MALHTVPITRAEAQRYVEENHRYLGKVVGAKFQVAVACAKQDKIVGVLIAGRPIARHLDDGFTLEIRRCCTDGTKNACSKLYGAICKTAHALGYKKVITYTSKGQGSGASLKASGFKIISESPGTPWNHKGRPRVDLNPNQAKFRWERAM